MGTKEDFWLELISEAFNDLEAKGDTYPDELVTELKSVFSKELLAPLKPAQMKEMAQRLGKANRGNL